MDLVRISSVFIASNLIHIILFRLQKKCINSLHVGGNNSVNASKDRWEMWAEPPAAGGSLHGRSNGLQRRHSHTHTLIWRTRDSLCMLYAERNTIERRSKTLFKSWSPPQPASQPRRRRWRNWRLGRSQEEIHFVFSNLAYIELSNMNVKL